MAKSKNVDLTGVLGASEGPEIDLTDVDTSKPLTTNALDALREKAEPKPGRKARASATRRPETAATEVARSLDTEALGSAYEKTSARMSRKIRPLQATERPMTNLKGEVVEGLTPEERDEKDESPTNVPRNFGRDGKFRNQIHGDYSHFAKLINLADFLGRKTEEAQNALGNHPAAGSFDDIHRILSVAHGHIMDAQAAHLRGETGLTRRNPDTGRAEVIGKQFLRSGGEDPFGRKFKTRGSEDQYGSVATTRAIGFNPIAKVNAEIGEPQLKGEGISTDLSEDTPFGAVPHFHRAAQLIATASNLLQDSIADVSSDKTIGAKVKPWDGRYDWRAGDPEAFNHAGKISSDYAESVAKGATSSMEEADAAVENPSSVREMFDRTKRAREAEIKAKEQQADIHFGLVKTAYERFFGKTLAARQAAASKKSEELSALPVVLPAKKVTPFDPARAPSHKAELEWSVEKQATASDLDFAKEQAQTGLESASNAVNSLGELMGHANSAAAQGRLTAEELSSIKDLASKATGHFKDAAKLSGRTKKLEKTNFGIAEPQYVYDPAKDPRIKRTLSEQLRYEKMTPEEKDADLKKFLKTRGQTLSEWQRDSQDFEDKFPVIAAQDAALKAQNIRDVVKAKIEHHSTISGHAYKAYSAVSEIHKKLNSLGIITDKKPEEIKPDLTGVPSLETFARASRPGRIASRSEALALMKQENEKAQADAAAKAQAEADKAAEIASRRSSRGTSAIEQARELGFYTYDESDARGFIEAGSGTRSDVEAGTRRGDFLRGLAAKGAVEFSAKPKSTSEFKPLFISPVPPSVEVARVNSMSPKRAKKAARAAARVEAKSKEFVSKKLAEKVSGLGVGLNLEDAMRVDVPEAAPKVTTPEDIRRQEEQGVVDALKRAEASSSNINVASARESLSKITEFNDNVGLIRTNLAENERRAQTAEAGSNPVTEVGTTIKPTRRTRK